MPSLSVAVYGMGKVGRELVKTLIRQGNVGEIMLADPTHTMQEVIDMFNRDSTYGLPKECTQYSNNEILIEDDNGNSCKMTYVQESDRSNLPLGAQGIIVTFDCTGNTENITTCGNQFINAGSTYALVIVPSSVSSSEWNSVLNSNGITIYDINHKSHSGDVWYVPDAQYISCAFPTYIIDQQISGKGYTLYNVDCDLQVSNLSNSLLNSYRGYGTITGTRTDFTNNIGKKLNAIDYELTGKAWSTVVEYPVGQGSVTKISITSTQSFDTSAIYSALSDYTEFTKDGRDAITNTTNSSGFFKVTQCDKNNGKEFLIYPQNLFKQMNVHNEYQTTFFIGYDAVNVMVCELIQLMSYIY